jgi:hypothetical protein
MRSFFYDFLKEVVGFLLMEKVDVADIWVQ